MATIKSKAVRTYFLELSQVEAEQLHENLTAQGVDSLDGYPKELQEALDKQLNRAKPGRKSAETEESEPAATTETEEAVKTGPKSDGDGTLKVERDKHGNVKSVTGSASDAAANAAAQAAASKKVSVPVG